MCASLLRAGCEDAGRYGGMLFVTSTDSMASGGEGAGALAPLERWFGRCAHKNLKLIAPLGAANRHGPKKSHTCIQPAPAPTQASAQSARLQRTVPTCAPYSLARQEPPTITPQNIPSPRQAPGALPGSVRRLPALPAVFKRAGPAHADRRGCQGGCGARRGAAAAFLLLLIPRVSG